MGRIGKLYRCSPSDWMFMAQRLTDPGECLLWKGATDKDGYGQVHRGAVPKAMEVTRAHQMSYVMAYGPVPDGHVVRHKCDNPSCVNPYHLESGTVAQNNADSYLPGRTKRKPWHGKRKITKEQYMELMSRKGERSSDVANDYGLSYSMVCAYWRGQYAASFL